MACAASPHRPQRRTGKSTLPQYRRRDASTCGRLRAWSLLRPRRRRHSRSLRGMRPGRSSSQIACRRPSLRVTRPAEMPPVSTPRRARRPVVVEAAAAAWPRAAAQVAELSWLRVPSTVCCFCAASALPAMRRWRLHRRPREARAQPQPQRRNVVARHRRRRCATRLLARLPVLYAAACGHAFCVPLRICACALCCDACL